MGGLRTSYSAHRLRTNFLRRPLIHSNPESQNAFSIAFIHPNKQAKYSQRSKAQSLPLRPNPVYKQPISSPASSLHLLVTLLTKQLPLHIIIIPHTPRKAVPCRIPAPAPREPPTPSTPRRNPPIHARGSPPQTRRNKRQRRHDRHDRRHHNDRILHPRRLAINPQPTTLAQPDLPELRPPVPPHPPPGRARQRERHRDGEEYGPARDAWPKPPLS